MPRREPPGIRVGRKMASTGLEVYFVVEKGMTLRVYSIARGVCRHPVVAGDLYVRVVPILS